MFYVAEVIETKKSFKSEQKDDEGNPIFNGAVQVKIAGDIGIFREVQVVWAAPTDFNRRIPLIGELVLVFKAPTVETHDRNQKTDGYYYLSIINSVNNLTTHHFPLSFKREINRSWISKALSEIIADKEQVGYTFSESAKSAKMLQPFEGDDLWEGRHGQSIRFTRHFEKVNSPGKSIYEQNSQTYWKGKSQNDPIMILKVKKPDRGGSNPYDIEDIDKDESSIYMTTTHKILKLKAGFTAHSNAKTLGTWDKGSQIVVNSDRVVINAKDERAFIIGKEQVVVTGKKVLLQSKKYSVDLDDLMDWLEKAYAEYWKLSTAQANLTTAMGPTAIATNSSVVTKIHKADWAKTFKKPA